MGAVTSSIWAFTVSMFDVQALCGLSHPLCGLLQPLCMMHARNVGCYFLYLGCYILYTWCVDDMLGFASSMHDAQALCGLLHLLCGLLNQLCGLLHPLCRLLQAPRGLFQPLCMMYRHYVCYCIFFGGCYSLYVRCTGTMWAITVSI